MSEDKRDLTGRRAKTTGIRIDVLHEFAGRDRVADRESVDVFSHESDRVTVHPITSSRSSIYDLNPHSRHSYFSAPFAIAERIIHGLTYPRQCGQYFPSFVVIIESP